MPGCNKLSIKLILIEQYIFININNWWNKLIHCYFIFSCDLDSINCGRIFIEIFLKVEKLKGKQKNEFFFCYFGDYDGANCQSCWVQSYCQTRDKSSESIEWGELKKIN